MQFEVSAFRNPKTRGPALAQAVLLTLGSWALRRWAPTPNSPLSLLQKQPVSKLGRSVGTKALVASHTMTWLTFLSYNWKSFKEPKKMVVTAVAWTAAGALLSAALFRRNQLGRAMKLRDRSGTIVPVILWGLFATAESAYLASQNRDPKFSPHNLPVLH